MSISVPVAPGELIDKITILEIKLAASPTRPSSPMSAMSMTCWWG